MRNRVTAIRTLLRQSKTAPVLVDIGASGGGPEIWTSIAQQSVYIGFDPDLREMKDTSGGSFSREVIVNEAVTNDSSATEVEFILTRFPFCSSTLEPDAESLTNYHFRDFFIPERRSRVRATTLSTVMQRLGLDRIDWLKTDTQGTDLRIFTSLPESLRNSVLALDIEPGLIDAYKGEDLFVDAHRHLVRNGFWAAGMNVCGAVRVRPDSLDAVVPDKSIHYEFADRALKKSPAWCEARYFRTLEWMAATSAVPDRYRLLWIFAIIDNQLGFALDVALEYQRRFGKDDAGRLMREESEYQIKRLSRYATLARVKRLVKKAMRRTG